MENKEENIFVCKLCQKKFDNYDSLRKHMSRVHKISSSDFYVEFYLNGIRPTCKCGCSKETSWTGHGFRDYKVGHISNIKCVFVNKEIQAKSAATRKQLWKEGKME